jgi:mannose-6-phosphate isomerase-like protein (cupin superfamily)
VTNGRLSCQTRAMPVRRVVTGHDHAGRAVVASDEEIQPAQLALLPGAEFHVLWGADETPRYPDRGEQPTLHAYYPPLGGIRFGLFAIPPDGLPLTSGLDVATALSEVEDKLPGMMRYADPSAPGMHTTPTLDFEIVLEGEVWLELDDGVEVQLRTGDTVVQNGTRHAWRNHGDRPAVLAVFMAGAKHDQLPR